MKCKLLTFIVCALSVSNIFSISLNELFIELEKNNQDLDILKNKVEFRKFDLSASKSYRYPSLSLNFGVSTGKKGDKVDTTDASGASVGDSTEAVDAGDEGVPSADSAKSSGQGTRITQNGWSADLGLSYSVFSKFAISTSVKNANNNLKSDQISHSMIINSKKAQLLQIILEINSLKRIKKTVDKAYKILLKQKNINKKNKGGYFGSKESRLKINIRFYEVNFQKTRIRNAILVATQALKDLIPSYEDSWFKSLPRIKVNYKVPKRNKAHETFIKESPKMELHNLSINSFKNTYNSTKWEKPWIPSIGLSASYSKSGKYEGKSNVSDNWKAAVLLSFNLFDGFYSSSRRGQAGASLRMAHARKQTETSKHLVLLNKYYMDYETSLAEHLFKKAIVEEKNFKIDMAKKISRAGGSTSLEVSILLLDHAHAKFEAHKSFKQFQQAMLDISLLLNKFNEVKINEKNI